MSLRDRICECKEGCIINSDQKLFSVYGERTSYFINNTNRKRISKYIVDDCLLAGLNDEQKCDYLFVVNNGETEIGYFVELKGGNVAKAIKQLISSIGHLGHEIDGEICGRIVCSKFLKAPDIKGSHPYLRLMKLVSGNLVVKSQKLTEIV